MNLVNDRLYKYTLEANEFYLEMIRMNEKDFTRNRCLNPRKLLIQMFGSKGGNQYAETLKCYDIFNSNNKVSVPGLFQARMKFNPEAVKQMAMDFTYDFYEEQNEWVVKLNGYVVTAIDGSTITLPATPDNYEKYRPNNVYDGAIQPCQGKLSLIFDCINKQILDIQVGEYMHSEIDYAIKHLEAVKANIKQQILAIFDRGYFSFELLLNLTENNQKYLFRLSSNHLSKYQEGLQVGDDKEIEVKLDRIGTNQFRDNNSLRYKLMETTFKIRIVKVKIDDTEEVLITNLSNDEFDIEALKELYHLRWDVETAYNVLKNKMKLEEFSGYRERLILQDIYSTCWLYNYIQELIIETNKENEIPSDRYKYKMKNNVNRVIGVVKTYFIMALANYEDKELAAKYNKIVIDTVTKELIPVRPNRKYSRKNAVNKSRISYRYSY